MFTISKNIQPDIFIFIVYPFSCGLDSLKKEYRCLYANKHPAGDGGDFDIEKILNTQIKRGKEYKIQNVCVKCKKTKRNIYVT